MAELEADYQIVRMTEAIRKHEEREADEAGSAQPRPSANDTAPCNDATVPRPSATGGAEHDEPAVSRSSASSGSEHSPQRPLPVRFRPQIQALLRQRRTP